MNEKEKEFVFSAAATARLGAGLDGSFIIISMISCFLPPSSYIPKSILITSCHLIFQIYTMLADHNAQIVF